MENFNVSMVEVMGVIGLMLGEYVLVLMAVLADLASGLRKAKKRGEARRSKALRRTVDKVSRYYNALFALSVIDAMQMVAVLYLRMTDTATVPILPVFTLFGALSIAIIEVKSIYEKASEKEQADADEAVRMVLKLLGGTCGGKWRNEAGNSGDEERGGAE